MRCDVRIIAIVGKGTHWPQDAGNSLTTIASAITDEVARWKPPVRVERSQSLFSNSLCLKMINCFLATLANERFMRRWLAFPILVTLSIIASYCALVTDSYPTRDAVHVVGRGVVNQSSADVDAQKYAASNFSFICDFNRRTSKLFSGAHHKTGSSLLNVYIVNTLIKYWIRQCIASQPNASIPTAKRERFDVEWGIGHGHTDTRKLGAFVASRRLNEQHVVLVHLIRHPLDTILSGYNYHKVTWEKWTKTVIRTLRRRSDLCEALDAKLAQMNASLLDDSLQHIYAAVPLSLGLDIEYQRFMLCAFPHMLESYSFVENIDRRIKPSESKYTHVRNLRLESFERDFNATMQVILSMFGVLNARHRASLLNALQAFNVYEGHKAQRVVTSGSYDKQRQVAVLLADVQRCAGVKRAAALLDYQWTWTDYC